jgi:acylphosphatase
MLVTYKYIISGKVQGVWFRKSTQDVAKKHHVVGHALNLPNGNVEVIATGSELAHQVLHDFLLRGPEHARVDAVEANMLPFQEFSDFVTG